MHTDLIENHDHNDDLNKSLHSEGLAAKDIILKALEAGLLDFVSLSSFCDLQTERRTIIQMRTGPGDPPLIRYPCSHVASCAVAIKQRLFENNQKFSQEAQLYFYIKNQNAGAAAFSLSFTNLLSCN